MAQMKDRHRDEIDEKAYPHGERQLRSNRRQSKLTNILEVLTWSFKDWCGATIKTAIRNPIQIVALQIGAYKILPNFVASQHRCQGRSNSYLTGRLTTQAGSLRL
jgi:hypothetical protein